MCRVVLPAASRWRHRSITCRSGASRRQARYGHHVKYSHFHSKIHTEEILLCGTTLDSSINPVWNCYHCQRIPLEKTEIVIKNKIAKNFEIKFKKKKKKFEKIFSNPLNIISPMCQSTCITSLMCFGGSGFRSSTIASASASTSSPSSPPVPASGTPPPHPSSSSSVAPPAATVCCAHSSRKKSRTSSPVFGATLAARRDPGPPASLWKRPGTWTRVIVHDPSRFKLPVVIFLHENLFLENLDKIQN